MFFSSCITMARILCKSSNPKVHTATPQPPKATRVTRCHVVPCFRCRRLLTANERSAKKGRSARTTQQVRPCGWAGCRPPTMGRKGCQTHKPTRGANGGAGCTAPPARQGTDSWNGLGVGPVFGLSLSRIGGMFGFGTKLERRAKPDGGSESLDALDET